MLMKQLNALNVMKMQNLNLLEQLANVKMDILLLLEPLKLLVNFVVAIAKLVRLQQTTAKVVIAPEISLDKELANANKTSRMLMVNA